MYQWRVYDGTRYVGEVRLAAKTPSGAKKSLIRTGYSPSISVLPAVTFVPKPRRRRKAQRARVTARGRRATRKRNPIPRGRPLGDKSFTLSTLRAVKQGGRAEKIWYEDARDGKHYYHDFDGAQGAVMYLCESAAVGKCVLIISGDLATPLWEDA